MSSLVKEILRITARQYSMGYAQLYEHLYEETVYGKKLKKRSLSVTLNRLKKKGLLKAEDNEFSITNEGISHLEKVVFNIKSFSNQKTYSIFIKKDKKLIVIFDIPEKRRDYRNWLRSELIGFGFTMIQKSVWLGPNLPKEFIEYLNEVDILEYLRFFQGTEKDVI